MFESFLSASLLGKARAVGLVSIDFVDPRDFAAQPHRSVDDSPYGGGAGMVMKVEPVVAAIESIERAEASSAIMLAPSGTPLTQETVRRLAALDHVILVCGRYEGPDERIIDLAIDEVVSVGDYVLSGGEAAAITIIDAVSRLIPGVLGNVESTEDESFEDGLLEYPHYTRPVEFRALEVPDVLRGGNHAAIAAWRRQKSIERTRDRRADLFGRHVRAVPGLAERTYVALVHHPVIDRTGAEVTSSVTNLDLHDIARAATTYGLAGYLAVSPIESQRDKITGITETWAKLAAAEIGDHRHRALGLLRACESIEHACALVARRHRKKSPRLIATSAQPGATRLAPDEVLAEIADGDRPTMILFGTGWGLAERVLDEADHVMAPILGASDFNHLSVRSAVAIVLDRLFGATSKTGS